MRPLEGDDVGPEIEVGDTTVSYHYRNRWSLVTFLRNHLASAANLSGFVDDRPHTLQFVVPTETVDGVVVSGHAGQARVFVRVTLIDPESKAPLLLPSFPREAPPLPASVNVEEELAE